MQKDLPSFLRQIKQMRYPVKLDTSGWRPQMLRQLVDEKLIDYIAMDLKAPLKKYALLTGGWNDAKKIEQSMEIIIQSGIDHELRTTVVKPLLREEDMPWLSSLAGKAKRYKLQRFIPHENILDKTLMRKDQYTQEEMFELQAKWGKQPS